MNHATKEHIRRQLVAATLEKNPNARIATVSNECLRLDTYKDGALVRIQYDWNIGPMLGEETEVMH